MNSINDNNMETHEYLWSCTKKKLRWKHKFVYQCHSHLFGSIWFSCTLSLKCIKLNNGSRMKMCKIDPPDIKHKHVWNSVLWICLLLAPWARVFTTHESKTWQYYIYYIFCNFKLNRSTNFCYLKFLSERFLHLFSCGIYHMLMWQYDTIPLQLNCYYDYFF